MKKWLKYGLIAAIIGVVFGIFATYLLFACGFSGSGGAWCSILGFIPYKLFRSITLLRTDILQGLFIIFEYAFIAFILGLIIGKIRDRKVEQVTRA